MPKGTTHSCVLHTDLQNTKCPNRDACRARQLDAREAAVAARERAAGGGLDSDLMAATLEALPNGNGGASAGGAVRSMGFWCRAVTHVWTLARTDVAMRSMRSEGACDCAYCPMMAMRKAGVRQATRPCCCQCLHGPARVQAPWS